MTDKELSGGSLNLVQHYTPPAQKLILEQIPNKTSEMASQLSMLLLSQLMQVKNMLYCKQPKMINKSIIWN